MNYPKVTYIVYHKQTLKIADTFEYWRGASALCKANKDYCVINVTHPATKELLNKIIEANK